MQEFDLQPAMPLARRLRLQQIAIFIQVIESGSVLAASRQLAMTQPAVSKSIQDLENQVGVALFERSKRGMALTDFGKTFENHAKIMLSQLRYLSEDLESWKTGAAGHLIVGTLIAASATMLPDALGILRRLAPNMKVTVKVGANATLYPMLIKGEVDMVLGILPEDASIHLPDPKGAASLKHVALYEEGMHVVVSSRHALAARRKVAIHELEHLEWIVPTRDSATFQAVLRFFREQQLPFPARVIESVSILTNLELLIRWDMIGFMPRSVAQRFEGLGLVKILEIGNLDDATTMGYTVRSDREQSVVIQSFIRALREASGGA